MNMNGALKRIILGNSKEMQDAINEGSVVMKDEKPYCAKCGDLLINEKNAFGYFFRCQKCDPVILKQKQEAEEIAKKELQKSIDNAKRECFSNSKKALTQTFENDTLCNSKESKRLKAYIEHFSTLRHRGTGVLIFGGSGTGKTFLARATLHALIERNYRAKEIKIIKAYNSVCYNGEKREDFINNLLHYNVVLIDDIGTERNNENMIEFVYDIIDTLYENKIPVIYTTNLAFSTFTNADKETNLGRIYDRIKGSTIPLEINNKNMRTEELKETITLWNEIS